MTDKILLLSGDGIGPEIVGSTERVIHALGDKYGYSYDLEHSLLGGCGIDADGDSLPQKTLELAKDADAILLCGNELYQGPWVCLLIWKGKRR